MLRDVDYFETRIGGFDGAAETADYFVKMVKAKPVPKPKTPTPPPPAEPTTETNGTSEPATQEKAKSTTEDKASEEAPDPNNEKPA